MNVKSIIKVAGWVATGASALMGAIEKDKTATAVADLMKRVAELESKVGK
mgnify:CR=1 FL=1